MKIQLPPRRLTLFKSASALALALVLSSHGSAQIPGLSPAAQSAAPVKPEDPLGRSTPRGTITAFIDAMHRNDLVAAPRFLQITPSQRNNVATLTHQLNELMDRYFSQPVSAISESPTGSVNDGLPLDRERVGPLKIGNRYADIVLARVNDPDAGYIWLISSATLAQVPELYGLIEKPWIERVMPQPLLRPVLFGVSAGQVIVWSASVAAPLLLFWALSALFVVISQRIVRHPATARVIALWHARLRWPFIITLALAAHIMLVPLLATSLRFRITYVRVVAIALLIALTWLARRFLTLFFDRARSLVHGRDHNGTESLLLLGERLLKVVVVLVALFSVLTIAGVDTTTALAGLGIGGVAVALGAQRTVENLIGGIFLLTDRALAVGDQCSISNRVGTVEDITLRSVRLRTTEQTLLSVPAGSLAQGNIENFTTRTKILAQTTLNLGYGTTADQLRSIIDRIRTLLDAQPKVERESSRIRLVNFGARAIELELFAYILTPDYLEFLAVREALLLQIATIVESAGSEFAQPTQIVYLPGHERGDVPASAPDTRQGALPGPRSEIPGASAHTAARAV